MHEMRDVGPEGLIPLHEVEDRAKAFGLDAHPQRVDVFGGQLALAPGGVQLAFEVIEGDLPDDGVDHVLDLAGQQDLALGRGLCRLQQLAEGQHLAEHAGSFGQRQRGGGEHLALARRQHLMHAVAKLMRQRHHVARFAKVVEHHIGMHFGDGGVRKGARGLAGLHARIDPALVEERLGQRCHFRGEGGIGIHHHGPGGGPVDHLHILGRQRRIAVPDLQPVQPQPFRLQRIVAMAQPRIGRDHRIAQRLHHLWLHMVRQVAAILRGRHLAPAVLDVLFLGQRVVDAGEQLHVPREDRRQRPRPRLAPGAHRVRQQVQRRFKVQWLRLPLHLEHQPGHRLVEKAVPGGCAHGGLVVQELLHLIRQLVRAHGAHPVEDGGIAGEVGTLGQSRFQMLIGQAVELQAEEHQRRGEIRHLVLRVGHELGAGGVECVLVIAQARIGHDPPRHRLDPLIAVDAGQHGLGIEIGQPPLEIIGEIAAGLLQPDHVIGKFRCIGRGVEVGQVPFGQLAKTAAGGRVCIVQRAGKADRHRETSSLCSPRHRVAGARGARVAYRLAPRSMRG